MRCARISLKRIPLRQGPFIVPSSRQSKSKLHRSTSTVPMSGDAIGDGDVVVWHFSWSCCCYNVASWGLHPLLELRVLEFSERAMFWTLVLEMFIVGQFVYCRHSILQWGCQLFLSALCVNIVWCHLVEGIYMLRTLLTVHIKCMLFVVGHGYGDVVCAIESWPTWNRSSWKP